MREVGKGIFPKDIDVEIGGTGNGIYRIAGLDDTLGITFNQFLIGDTSQCHPYRPYRKCTRK